MKKKMKQIVLMALLVLTAATVTAVPAQAGKRKAAKVVWHREYKKGRERVTVKGLDSKKKTVWTYQSKPYRCCDDVVTKCVVRKYRVYVFEKNKINVFRKSDKKKLWTVKTAIKGGYVYKFDKKENLYLAGYHFPEVYKISKVGKKIWKANVLKTGSCFPSKLKISGKKLKIKYEQNDNDPELEYKHKVTFNAKTGKILNYY